jgi:hypothetical protein
MTNEVPVGLLRLAHIIEINEQQGYITAELEFASKTLAIDKQKQKKVQIPFSFYSNEGMFVGGKPKLGTPVIIGQGEGTNWYFVSFLVSNPTTIPALEDGEVLIQASNDSKIILSTDNTLNLGGDVTQLHLNNTSKKLNNKFQVTHNNNFIFSEALRNVSGVVKREVLIDGTVPSYQKLASETYDSALTPIGLDPQSTVVINSNGPSKNPPFIEKKEIVYEFAYSSNVSDDITEASIYSSTQQQQKPVTQYQLPNRRQSKTDGFSLSLVAPNFLMETVKGTGVDIFGNVLDINRSPILGYGVQSTTLSLNSPTNKDVAFLNIKAAERRSLVYHFEINARKDLTAQNGQAVLPNINSSADYARSRSRFFFDIDKEGQLKLNVPASSETGNILLHARYENYSTFGPEDNNNPNKFIIRDDYLDVFLDSYAIGVISVNDQNGSPATPIDRIAEQHILHGMPFHSITASGQLFQSNLSQQFINYQNYQFANPINVSQFPTINNIVSPLITVSGQNANAGGRSGSMNFDGSLEVSIGANTIDRQSLWLDTAGGIVANIGRDANYASAVVSLDGDMLVQIGGYGISSDSRFQGQNPAYTGGNNNAYRGGALDIRVLNDGFTATVIRIDKNGVSIMTPKDFNIYAGGTLNIGAGNINMEAETMYIQNRLVTKKYQKGSPGAPGSV